MVGNDLIEKIIYKSNKNQYIDKNTIKEIIEHVISKSDKVTRDKFNGVNFKDSQLCYDACSVADVKQCQIIVDYDKMTCGNDSSMLEANLDIVATLLHEISHLEEFNKIKRKDLEAILLNASDLVFFENLAISRLKKYRIFLSDSFYTNLIIRLQQKLYLKIYDKIPSERLADINAYRRLYESISSYHKFDELYQDAYYAVKYSLIEQYFSGYNKTLNKSNCCNVPLIDYFKFIKQEHLLEKFHFYSKDLNQFLNNCSNEFTLEERMRFGLPITSDEIKDMSKTLFKKM